MSRLHVRRTSRCGVCRSRGGFALVEMAIVLIVLGLVLLIVMPKARTAMVRSDLRSARTTLVAQVNRGKIAAISRNRRATVAVDAGRVWVETTPRLNPLLGSTSDTVGTVVSLPEQYGVTLTPTTTSLSFDARGIGLNPSTPVSFGLAKDGETMGLTVNGLGRIIH